MKGAITMTLKEWHDMHDENARLRSEVERLTREAQDERVRLGYEIGRLNAEVERLRGIEAAARDVVGWADGKELPVMLATAILTLHRAALSPREPAE